MQGVPSAKRPGRVFLLVQGSCLACSMRLSSARHGIRAQTLCCDSLLEQVQGPCLTWLMHQELGVQQHDVRQAGRLAGQAQCGMHGADFSAGLECDDP